MILKHPLHRAAAVVLALAVSALSVYTPSVAQTKNAALQACTPGATAAPASAKAPPAYVGDTMLTVVSTVSPITNMAFNIGGARLKITGLVPEGVNSHTFEPKPSDAALLAEADLIFVNGLDLELPSMKLAQANLKDGAELIELGPRTIEETDWAYDFSFPKDGGKPNPHLWINPLLTLRYAEIMRDAFIRRDPAGKDYYEGNYAVLAERIAVLDQAICDTVQTIPEKNRKLLTYHDSYAYFAPRYGMTVIGAIQPADFSEPSVREIAEIIDQIKAEGIPAIFGSEVFPSPILEQIGKETGARFIDTLADDDLPNKDGDRLYHSYLQLMVNNVTTIAEALGGTADALKAVDTSNVPGPDNAVANARE